ncbi:MAG: hypothetical protein A3F68_03645 [Acidobacteria bacterium RIFCSPLOWO2_12_FULL_54_10]|nr:MAG: hypothetical protein A3F68_03645 [Acidobacteria bacterium RIFCSPLOWO2_12_FULL_54_10]
MIGETISHFQIKAKIGQGGMGVVYRGVDTDLDRPVAIKILDPSNQKNEETTARFLREAKTASKLQHPAITTIYEFGVKDDLRYIVMEFIEGKTLKQTLQSGPLPVKQIIEIAITLADALSLAGEKGIIHRDIKSENIMLDGRGQVKILDFGLAKMADLGDGVKTDTFKTVGGLVLGTVSYMSPEQALGAVLDMRTDLYSLGVVFYEMATGNLPFTGQTQSIVLAKILNQAPKAVRDLNQEISQPLEKIIHRCLEKDRENRYPDATALVTDLRAARSEFERSRDWAGTVVMSPISRPTQQASSTSSAPDTLQDLIVAAPRPNSGSEAGVSSSPTLISNSPGAAISTPPPSSGVSNIPSDPRPITSSPGNIPSDAGSQTDSGAKKKTEQAASVGKAWRLPLIYLIRLTRKTISSVGLIYSLALVALFFLPALRLQGSGVEQVVGWIHWLADPLVALATGFIDINLTFQRFNVLILILALAIYFVKMFTSGRMEWMEGEIRRPMMPKLPSSSAAAASAAAGAQRATRMTLLREYAVAKQILSSVKKDLAFLAIDVIGSTKMKVGEDKLAIEHAFAEYKKFLERVFRENQAYRVSWTPDGVMSCFLSAEEASCAAKALLVGLDWFNKDVHHLKTGFHVRTGMNVGEVNFPDDKALEEISDEVIDVAGHMQKYADGDTLWISEDAFNRLIDRSGYTPTDKQVDNRKVYVWRKPSN